MQGAISLFAPTTPPRRTRPMEGAHLPIHSSPLASSPSSPKSSPLVDAHARRRAQYKSHDKSPTRAPLATRRSAGVAAPARGSAEVPRKAVLRERFRVRWRERVQQDRERIVRGRRSLSSEGSSEGDELMDEDGDEDEGKILNDELFQRIVASASHRRQHQYRLSYAQDVGSSFDPDMEDISGWEHELHAEEPAPSTLPQDLDEEELEAYAEEYDLDLDNLPLDEIFSLSDIEEEPEPEPGSVWKGKGRAVDTDMDTTV